MGFPALAQNRKLFLELNKTYELGQIYKGKSLNSFSATNITLINDSILNYTDKNTGIMKSMNIRTSDVNFLKIKSGTKAGQYALYGGALMLSFSLVSVLSAEQEMLEETGDTSGEKWFPVVGGATAVGAVIGAIIGAFSPKYKNFYLKDNSTAFILSVTPQYNPGKEVGIGIRFTF
jgi:hypothetical protein